MIRLFKRYYPVKNIFFVLGEGMIIFMTLALTGTWMNGGRPWEYLLMTLICQVWLYYGGLYDLGALESLGDLFGRLIQSLGAAVIILSLVHFELEHVVYYDQVFAQGLLNIVALAVCWRLLYTLTLNRRLFDKTVLVLGESPLIRAILQEASQQKDSGYHLIHAVPGRCPDHSRWAYCAPFDAMDENNLGLLTLAQTLNASLIVSDKDVEGHTRNVEEALLECRRNGMKILDAQSFFEMITGKLHASQFIAFCIECSEGFHRPFINRAVKNVLDKLGALALLILLSPLMVLIAILIKLDSSGPVFSRQDCLGEGRKPYRLLEFRTISQDSHVTRVGALLQNFRIDEIPQLWNVLKGDMSLVGPGPEQECCVDRLETEIPCYGVRFGVKPGITGWARVNCGFGAGEDDTLEKLNYDLFYIKNSSVFMDLFILFKTTRMMILGGEQGNPGQPDLVG